MFGAASIAQWIHPVDQGSNPNYKLCAFSNYILIVM